MFKKVFSGGDVFQRFLRWLLSDILTEFHQKNDALYQEFHRENNDLRRELSEAVRDFLQAKEQHQKDLQELSQVLTNRLDIETEQHKTSQQALAAEIAIIRIDSQAKTAALQVEFDSVSSDLRLEIKQIEKLSKATDSRLGEISVEFESLRKEIVAQVKSLICTVAIVNQNTNSATASVKRVEDSWAVVQQALDDRFVGMEASLKQSLIKMSWDIDRIEKEPNQLRTDLTSRCEQIIVQNREVLRKELQKIGQFSSVVYRKLLELDGTAPASLYGRIKLPLKQGDPVIQESPTAVVMTGTSLDAQVDSIHRRLAIIEILLTAPLMSPVSEEGLKVEGNSVTWAPNPAHFGNKIGE